jgi:DNA-binding CsgD family transcriptional regulator
MKKKSFQIISILFVALILFFAKTYSQSTIGLPEIYNFSYDKIKAGAQTWQIAQDRFGIMYFANNSGLVTYNGKEWKLFPLPNKTIVRCIMITDDDKIYVGGQDAIGYFFPDRNGSLQYHSLTQLIPQSKSAFGDIWYIQSFKNYIFFQSSSKIFRLDPVSSKVEVYDCPNQLSWSFMGISHNILYAQIGNDKLVFYNNGRWESINAQLLQKTLITSIVDFAKDTSLVSTISGGVFLMTTSKFWRISIPHEIITSQIFKVLRINADLFAIATVSNGIYIINTKWKIIKHFSTINGMQNNNVLSIFADNHSNIWSGLDEGIDLINYASPFQKINPLANTIIPIYTANVFEKKLYLATSNGLYVTGLTLPDPEDLSFSQSVFTKVPNTERQVWGIFNDGRHLLMAHHYGSYLIKNNQPIQLNNNTHGSWLFRKVPGSNNIIAGTYDGILLLHNNFGEISSALQLNNSPNEPLRFLEIDSIKHIIWASHPYRGVYQLQMSTDYSSIDKVTLFTQKDGLPSDLNNFVFKINGQIVFTTDNGIYEFDYAKHSFNLSKQYLPLFKNTLIKYLVSDEENRIWFASEKGIGVVENNKPTYIPELDGKMIAGFENIYPYNNNNIFIGSHKGMIHLNYNSYRKKHSPISALLNKVVAISNKRKDSILYNGYYVFQNKIVSDQSADMIANLSAGYNSFHFEFTSTLYESIDKIEYSYKLEGFDKDWSEWSDKTDKDYTNLSYGTYTFYVKAKDNLGNISNPILYSFKIKPQWYQTYLAYALYALLFISIFYVAKKLLSKRLQKIKEKFLAEQQHMKYVHELELVHNEKEIVQLKNEHLETEMLYKNNELASTTMHLYKRGRLLGKIKEDLSGGIKKLNTKEEKSDFYKLLKLIAEEEKQDNDWNQFAVHFDNVHNQFLHKIKTTYPELTPNDLKICAYLKMNLSSKKIAQLLNITLKGVEIARYRLRKKLQLPQEANLTNFINEFDTH